MFRGVEGTHVASHLLVTIIPSPSSLSVLAETGSYVPRLALTFRVLGLQLCAAILVGLAVLRTVGKHTSKRATAPSPLPPFLLPVLPFDCFLLRTTIEWR